ncbi:hypothetical protein HDU82_007546 [Entophlyctis luteolus]|nr:hypothetical protein HDU82_007546 [Entophlyctis luteolus]
MKRRFSPERRGTPILPPTEKHSNPISIVQPSDRTKSTHLFSPVNFCQRQKHLLPFRLGVIDKLKNNFDAANCKTTMKSWHAFSDSIWAEDFSLAIKYIESVVKTEVKPHAAIELVSQVWTHPKMAQRCPDDTGITFFFDTSIKLIGLAVKHTVMSEKLRNIRVNAINKLQKEYTSDFALPLPQPKTKSHSLGQEQEQSVNGGKIPLGPNVMMGRSSHDAELLPTKDSISSCQKANACESYVLSNQVSAIISRLLLQIFFPRSDFIMEELAVRMANARSPMRRRIVFDLSGFTFRYLTFNYACTAHTDRNNDARVMCVMLYAGGAASTLVLPEHNGGFRIACGDGTAVILDAGSIRHGSEITATTKPTPRFCEVFVCHGQVLRKFGV